jgi:anti-sigma factor RsiW
MHNDYTLLMSLVLDKEASAEEEAELRAHLRTCDECGVTWQRWQEIDRRFVASPLMPAPVGLVDLIITRVEQAQVVRTRRRHFVLWFGLAWVAAFVLTGGLALLVLNWPSKASAAAGAAVSGLLSVGQWLFAIAATTVANLGAPAVAATAGALLCLTCGLGMAWLWIINQAGAGQQRLPVRA